MKTVRHWKHSYKCDHDGADTVASLGQALRCAGLNKTDMVVRMMAVQLDLKGQSTYIADSGSLVFRLEGRH